MLFKYIIDCIILFQKQQQQKMLILSEDISGCFWLLFNFSFDGDGSGWCYQCLCKYLIVNKRKFVVICKLWEKVAIAKFQNKELVLFFGFSKKKNIFQIKIAYNLPIQSLNDEQLFPSRCSIIVSIVYLTEAKKNLWNENKTESFSFGSLFVSPFREKSVIEKERKEND